ncbi:FkbM family methyltransferase [Mesorhizobium sp. M1378]|uniref:FkbM family methyltransferase n=1 Tax=Mesorhizobium sp. M1378 TaxID=2957092 RepID=UPI0033359074
MNFSIERLRRLDDFFRSHPLTRDARYSAWLRFLAWQLRSSMGAEVIVPWISGQKLAVRRGMTGATGNIYSGLHEFYDMSLVLHFLRQGDLFLDVGANVGSYTVLASGVCSAETWAFEPDILSVQRLRRNIQINGLEHRVKVFEAAVGDQRKDVSFTVGKDTVNRVSTSRLDNDVRVVRQVRLDDVINGARPSMIKIDVEGYEENVIAGADATLALDSLKLIELETLSPVIEKKLEGFGFSRGFYDAFSRTMRSHEALTNPSNACFVRDWEFVNKRLAEAPAVSVLGKEI